MNNMSQYIPIKMQLSVLVMGQKPLCAFNRLGETVADKALFFVIKSLLNYNTDG